MYLPLPGFISSMWAAKILWILLSLFSSWQFNSHPSGLILGWKLHGYSGSGILWRKRSSTTSASAQSSVTNVRAALTTPGTLVRIDASQRLEEFNDQLTDPTNARFPATTTFACTCHPILGRRIARITNENITVPKRKVICRRDICHCGTNGLVPQEIDKPTPWGASNKSRSEI